MAVDDVVFTVVGLSRCGLQVREVRATYLRSVLDRDIEFSPVRTRWLRSSKTKSGFAREDSREPLLLLPFSTKMNNRRDANRHRSSQAAHHSTAGDAIQLVIKDNEMENVPL